uniref:Uncharacterized protein n=1 Tax=Arundo donax TaxID=35708 RepID=A0A0A8ZBN2_ARUDO
MLIELDHDPTKLFNWSTTKEVQLSSLAKSKKSCKTPIEVQ